MGLLTMRFGGGDGAVADTYSHTNARYANRLLGMASAFLASVITSRAFLVAWPGEEAVQLSNFFHSDLIDWQITDEVRNSDCVRTVHVLERGSCEIGAAAGGGSQKAVISMRHCHGCRMH